MKSKLTFSLILLGLFMLVSCSKSVYKSASPANSDKYTMDILLFIGQSNMSGVGPIKDLDTVTLANVFLFNADNNWEPAKNLPGVYGGIHRYSTSNIGRRSQLSPTYTAARKIANVTGRKIGIVANARGGTRISWWQKGYTGENDFDLYENAITRAKAALAATPGAKIKGIFWHQGEGDNSKAASAVYMQELKSLIKDLRADLGDESIPFIAGEVGKWKERGLGVNPVIRQISKSIPHTDWVSSDGLTSINLPKNDPHFDTFSQRAFGERYADKALELIYNIKPEGVTLYNEANFEGRSVLLRSGVYTAKDLESHGIEGKEIASIKPIKGFKLQLVSTDGKSIEVLNEMPSFQPAGSITKVTVQKIN